jgi:hypothetical protein
MNGSQVSDVMGRPNGIFPLKKCLLQPNAELIKMLKKFLVRSLSALLQRTLVKFRIFYVLNITNKSHKF